jgi:aldehyde dehydrogenase (NAD+)
MPDPGLSPSSMPASSHLTVPLSAMREPVERGDTRPLAWKLEQRSRLEALLNNGEAAMAAALRSDLDRPPTEAAFETAAVRQELRHTRRHLRRWMRPALGPCRHGPGPAGRWCSPSRWAAC